MSSQKPKHPNRLGVVLFDRLIPAVLLVGVIVLVTQAAGLFLRYNEEANRAESRRPDYQATATALAGAQPTATIAPTETITPTPVVFQPYVFAKFSGAARQVFATNTPQPPLVIATNTPLPALETTPTPVPMTVEPGMTATMRPLPTPFFYGEAPADAVAPTAIPSPVPLIDRRYPLMNILLLGNDGEITEDGFFRTDTMIIVSINLQTNTVSMLSLPRDLYVYIPGWTMQRLNLAYVHGEAVGWTDGGFGLMRQTIFYNLGINVHYYAMVSLDGFRAIVDAVGGINLAVDCAIQDLPLIGAEVPRDAVRVTDDGEYALPVGYYTMNGGEALWYARSRGNSSDFDRGRRQQQVLRGVWRQARDNGLLGSLPALWTESQQYIETNLTLDDLIPLIPLAANLNPNQIESYTFNRLYHTTPWTPPDGSNVQLPNPEQVRELMIEFYTPATESQTANEAATVLVYNGTTIPNLDLVAAERLNWEGIAAVPMGAAETTDYADTVMIDYTGRSKASSLGDIVRTLNVLGENIRVEPSPTRDADFVVILGETYNSCTEGGVLPVEMPPAGG